MAKDKREALQAIVASLTDTGRHLAEAASILADGAVPTLRKPGATDPPSLLAIAELVSAGAEPVARSAPEVGRSVPLLAPMLAEL